MARRESRHEFGRTRRRDALALALLGSLLVPSRTIAAPPVQPGINWVRLDGAESCVSAAALAERVEARMRAVQFTGPRDAELFVDGAVQPAAGGGWDVRLEVSARDGAIYGRRDMHFDGEACEVIDEGVALVIAVTLYPGAGLANAGIPLSSDTAGRLDALFGAEPSDPTPDSVPAPSPPRAAEPAPATPLRPAQRTAATAEAALHVYADLTGFGALGQLPGASLGFSGHLGLELRDAWPIEIGATIFRDGSANARAPDEGRSRFELLLASIATCPWSPGWLPALAVCAGVEAGRLRAESEGFAIVRPSTDAGIANLLASGVFRLQLGGGLHLRIGGVVVLPLIQHAYTYRSDAAESVLIYRMPQIAARLELGAGLRF